MRIATYTRISTDEDRQPFSLGAQSERLEAYARSQDGWRIVRRFTDQASGATLDRPGLRQAMTEASAGVYELLLVYRVDRLSRSVRQLAQTAEDLERSGVALRSATEPFDTSSPAGKMMLQMLGVFAELERATIVERITAGMERAASQGRWVVGKVPFGYLRDKQSKLIHPHEPQADVVRRIFAMYVEGRMGAEAIAKALNTEGHRTKNGQPFARPIVLSIIANPIYAGKIEFRGTTHPGLHEPIVDAATHETARRISPSGENRRHFGARTQPTTCCLAWSAAGGAIEPTSGPRPGDGRASTTTTSAPRGTATGPSSAVATGCPRTVLSKRLLSRCRTSTWTARSSSKPSRMPRPRMAIPRRTPPADWPASGRSWRARSDRSIATSPHSRRDRSPPRTARSGSQS
jgi:DNA invertase Pin-like site-specific DNA recombinase